MTKNNALPPPSNVQRFNKYFDEMLPAAYAKLSTQPIEVQRVFLAACCERLYPNYVVYHRLTDVGSADKLREIIDSLWDINVFVAEGERRTVWFEMDNLISENYDRTFWSVLALMTMSAVQQSIAYIHQITSQPTIIIDKQETIINVGRWAVIAVEQYLWWLTLPKAIVTPNLVDDIVEVDGIAYHHYAAYEIATFLTQDLEQVGNHDDWVASAPMLHVEIQHQLDDIDLLLKTGATPETVDLLRCRSRHSGTLPLHRDILPMPYGERIV